MIRKPLRLKEGDIVAVVSPSRGSPNKYPKVYELGVQVVREQLHLHVQEYPTTRAGNEILYNNPKMRAEDLMPLQMIRSKQL
jgi:muramoyltetrapeptide carboxypeptidase LdcA involved in peptidoglycan recycling